MTHRDHLGNHFDRWRSVFRSIIRLARLRHPVLGPNIPSLRAIEQSLISNLVVLIYYQLTVMTINFSSKKMIYLLIKNLKTLISSTIIKYYFQRSPGGGVAPIAPSNTPLPQCKYTYHYLLLLQNLQWPWF